jgi:hypothetical protein
MTMFWFVPVAIALGAVGTKTGLEQRHLKGKAHRNEGWWLILVIAWAPLVLWALAQIVRQE